MPEMVNLLLLGTGTVGASIGLALHRASDSFRRVGYDPDRQTLRAAAAIEAFDKGVGRAADGAAEADLVVLCLEPTAARRALESLSGRLRPDVVILSTTPTQATLVEAWRAALGPANPYLAAVPFVGPAAGAGRPSSLSRHRRTSSKGACWGSPPRPEPPRGRSMSLSTWRRSWALTPSSWSRRNSTRPRPPPINCLSSWRRPCWTVSRPTRVGAISAVWSARALRNWRRWWRDSRPRPPPPKPRPTGST